MRHTVRALATLYPGVALTCAIVACGASHANTDGAADAGVDATFDTGTVDASAVEDADTGVDAAIDAAPCVYPPTPSSSAAVLQFHKNPSRDGVYVDPAFTSAAVAGVQLRLSAPLTGQAHAQPLYVPNGPGGHEIYIAATEANHVTAVDACGVKVDAMTQTAIGQATLRHMIHAVSVDDGTERPGWPIDVQARVPGFVSANQNQRGALTLVGGTLYVPYVGHFGDCAQYYGWIVGIPVSGLAQVTAWRTLGGSPWDAGATQSSGGGFWAPGGLPTDGTSIFAVSGNTMLVAGEYSPPSTWIGGETVFRLGAGPTFSGSATDYFYPTSTDTFDSWQYYDEEDQDLGATNGVLFTTGGARYLLAIDKMGALYLLNPANLGGAGGAVPAYWPSNFQSSQDVIGAPLVYTTPRGAYIGVPQISGTQFVFVSGNPPQVGLPPDAGPSSIYTGQAAPIATTPDGTSGFVIWTAETSGTGGQVVSTLYARDGTTGAVLANVPMPDSTHYFDPPIAANGRIVTAACGSCFGPPGGEFPPPPPGNGQLLFFY